jgi:hypothetical protein
MNYNLGVNVSPNTPEGGVAEVLAGSNITITGSPSLPVINALAGVTTVTGGSNITITGTAQDPVINAPNAGPSSGNISHFGNKTVPATEVASGGFEEIFTIGSEYFSNSNSSYLLTVDYNIPSATCSNVSGDLGISIDYNEGQITQQAFTLINQSTWSNATNLNRYANMATTFIPNVNVEPLKFYLQNYTNGTITTGEFYLQVSITGLTTSNTNANSWPPPP